MADNGNLASITFGAVTYDETDCLQGITLNLNGQPITFNCNGTLKSIPGIASYTLTANMAISKTDTAKVTALRENTTGTLEYHPAGDTATYIEYTSTNATVASLVNNGGSGNLLSLDITWNLDDLTDGAAT